MLKEDCIFCKIAKGEIPAQKVFENDKVIAFNDINPQAPVHVLVIPKEHVESIQDLEDNDLSAAMISGIRETAKKLGINEYRTVTNTGKSAGQEVFHLHFHLLSGRQLTGPLG